MECEEIRVDIRIPNPEGSKEAIRASQVMFKLNHTMPFTDEYNSLLKELFGDNLGEDSFVAAPISGACVSSMKIGNHAIIGAASVVTKDVPDYAVAVGNPAKVIRMLDEDKFEEKKQNEGN